MPSLSPGVDNREGLKFTFPFYHFEVCRRDGKRKAPIRTRNLAKRARIVFFSISTIARKINHTEMLNFLV
jgi:hypothetical protein